jgi:hypothetical protein
LLELGVAGQGAPHSGQFIGGNIPGVILAILPPLEFVIGAGGAGTLFKTIRGELSTLHGGNGRNLFQKTCFI